MIGYRIKNPSPGVCYPLTVRDSNDTETYHFENRTAYTLYVALGRTVDPLTVEDTAILSILPLGTNSARVNLAYAGTDSFTFLLDDTVVPLGTVGSKTFISVASLGPEEGIGTEEVNAPGAPPVTGADPTASIGLTKINGSALTFMRSDAAPPLSVSISPAWSGNHTFSPVNHLTPITIQSVTSGKRDGINITANLYMQGGYCFHGDLGASNDWYPLTANIYIIPNVGWFYSQSKMGGIVSYVNGYWRMEWNAAGTAGGGVTSFNEVFKAGGNGSVSKISFFGVTEVIKQSAAAVTDAFGNTGTVIQDVGTSFSQSILNDNFRALTDGLKAIRDSLVNYGLLVP